MHCGIQIIYTNSPFGVGSGGTTTVVCVGDDGWVVGGDDVGVVGGGGAVGAVGV